MRAFFVTASALALSALGQAAGQEAGQEADAVDEIVVYGSQVDLTDAYDGGQVARGARAGLLGNLDYLDTPFSSTAYTDELARAQQAVSVADVARNDPTVRLAKGFGNF